MSSKAKNTTVWALHRATKLTGNVESRELTYMYHESISRDTIYLKLEPHPFFLKCLLRFSPSLMSTPIQAHIPYYLYTVPVSY